MLRIYHRLDAAPSSVVFSHFSPLGSDELQSYGRIRERSIRFVGFGVYAPLLRRMEYTTVRLWIELTLVSLLLG